MTWLLMGRALGPVEAMRSQVAEISARDLDRRVPEPPVDDEIGRLARTMNAMLDRLQASSARQRRFVADASHELRSPLAAGRTQLEVALAHPADGGWQTTAAGLLREHQRMERLVGDLLFLARSDDGGPPVRAVPLDLDDVVFAEAAALRSRTSVRLDLSKVSGARVVGDAESLARVVRNLVENAERHARAVVAVELSVTEGAVELVVADDGSGIQPADREQVFDRFVRLDDARSRNDGGAGLGLAIVREIVVAHGGTVTVGESRSGARLVVRLPHPDGS
jgi:signal transduction histidine kinase